MVLAVDAKTQFASLQAVLARQKSVPITKQTQGADEIFDQFAVDSGIDISRKIRDFL